MDPAWHSFAPCSTSPRWRYLPDGTIEIEGEGAVRVAPKAWPSTIARWRPLVDASAAANGVPAHWIDAVMAVESGGREGQLGSNGTDVGLMQIQPATAGTVAGRPVSAAELQRDPALNIELGTRYLRKQLDLNGGDFVHAVIGYNAGSVRCGTGRGCAPTSWNVIMGCAGGVPNDYPRKAIAFANRALDERRRPAPAPPPIPVLAAGLSTGTGLAIFSVVAGLGYLAALRWGPR